MKSLKSLYDLSYDTSGFNSGIINWYNRLIDKTYDDLSVEDVCRMIRQDILRDIAIQKAIDLFLHDPYDGEYSDGDLLSVLVSLDIKLMNTTIREKLKSVLNVIEHEYVDFDWFDDESKVQYARNIERMYSQLVNANDKV